MHDLQTAVQKLQKRITEMACWATTLMRHTKKGDSAKDGYGPWIIRFSENGRCDCASPDSATKLCATINANLAILFKDHIKEYKAALRSLLENKSWCLNAEAIREVQHYINWLTNINKPCVSVEGDDIFLNTDWSLAVPCSGEGNDKASIDAKEEAETYAAAIDSMLQDVRFTIADSIKKSLFALI